ncbi:unnamed protein product [Caenorhabditis brenneri]
MEMDDPNYISEKFWNQLVHLVAHNKSEEAKKLFDPLFYFDSCGTFYNSSSVFDGLSSLTKKNIQIVYKPRSAHDYGNVIEFTINIGKNRKSVIEEVYILHKVNLQLVNGRVGNCIGTTAKKPVGRKT